MNMHVGPAIAGAAPLCLLFKAGDFVRTNDGEVGQVVKGTSDKHSPTLVLLLWNEPVEDEVSMACGKGYGNYEPGCLTMWTPDVALPVAAPALLPRFFTAGDYARTTDNRIVFVFDGNENGYRVVRTEREEEAFYRADELTPWAPLFGERVTESGTEEGRVTGVVVDTNDGTSLVMWPGFFRPQTWADADLEPAWD